MARQIIGTFDYPSSIPFDGTIIVKYLSGSTVIVYKSESSFLVIDGSYDFTLDVGTYLFTVQGKLKEGDEQTYSVKLGEGIIVEGETDPIDLPTLINDSTN